MYPTIQSRSTNEIHIVKDKFYSECGERYNYFYNQTRRDLRGIKFRELNEITCEACKSFFSSHNDVSVNPRVLTSTDLLLQQKQPL
ncbi:hypothetical protein CUU64_18115 [Bacillus sp. V5-8f]|nr:hypothetical protein CUU64_18115 [Bacillus sp. V5-8f]